MIVCQPRTGHTGRLLNSDYVTQAMAKVGNANVLVNLISRRVRQLVAGSRPLIDETATVGDADIALLEIIHDKMGYRMSALTVEEEEAVPVVKKRRHP